ncbi:hypothetical protein EVG20_g8910 [Dentipellis fragilis]|uniref:NAD(P)-binding protein n=1 Tax=Dentipellis fragilis TaxID=205917 RepID=A0A4Y9Y4X8_9AGAM|nr:hypothetical protein EVG20_g8910 [Dentipellis fragilis]
MLEKVSMDNAENYGLAPGEYIRGVVDSIPLKRVGQAQDIANMVSFLASDKASYITGQMCPGNGAEGPGPSTNQANRYKPCEREFQALSLAFPGTMSKGVALVTGAAQGIGRAIAIQLATDGFDIAVNDIAGKVTLLEALSKEIVSKGQRSIVTPGDVTSEKEVEAMVGEVATKLGSLDVMVANAGIYRANTLINTPVDEYDQLMTVNARGPMLCYKYAAKQMIVQGRGGRIIGAASIAGRRPYPGSLSYVMSKFAVRGLTQAAAIELGEYNITVNAYAPGLTRTPMLDNIDTIKTTQLGIASGEYIERRVNNIPIKRVGQPQDVANLVSFLASEKASYITGQTYGVDGGMIPS